MIKLRNLRFCKNLVTIGLTKSWRRFRRGAGKRWLCHNIGSKYREKADDSAGIRKARFAFPHYCHASNYASSKATVRRVEIGQGVGGGCRDRGAGGARVRRVAVAALLARRLPRCAIRSQREKPELIKAHNYLRFEPFVLTGVSCPI